MTRHEPAASQGCRSRYHNGFFRAPGGRAFLWGLRPPTWSPCPASTSRGGASGALIPFAPSAPPATTDCGC